MSTTKQSLNSVKKFSKPSMKYKNPSLGSASMLKKCPQAKGMVTKVVTMSPKKPNSAMRHIAKMNLMNGLSLTSSLPGKGYLCSKYNSVLVEGGSANDLPGVGYTSVSGVYDFSPVVGKMKRSSVYGVSSPSGYTNFMSSSLSSV